MTFLTLPKTTGSLPLLDSLPEPKAFTLSGYLKKLDITSFEGRFGKSSTDAIIHNRINLRWKPNAKLTFGWETRNRIFTGEAVSQSTDFAKVLVNTLLPFDLQKTWVSNQALVIHSSMERLFADWSDGNWQIRIGRQRINWGMTTTWNPNDIFNSYNFLDFDYEERAGSDAIYVSRNLNEQSGLALAFSPLRDGSTTTAIRYSFNVYRYDFQIIAGLFQDRPVAGGGWAGHIGDAGFKGEFTFFPKKGEWPTDLNLSLESDYLFNSNWYISGGLLLNGRGMNKAYQANPLAAVNPSPDNLMPAKWNLITTFGKELSPIVRESMSLVYSPGLNDLILVNSFRYNAATNLDLDFIWQSFFTESSGIFKAEKHVAFIRLKKSF